MTDSCRPLQAQKVTDDPVLKAEGSCRSIWGSPRAANAPQAEVCPSLVYKNISISQTGQLKSELVFESRLSRFKLNWSVV